MSRRRRSAVPWHSARDGQRDTSIRLRRRRPREQQAGSDEEVLAMEGTTSRVTETLNELECRRLLATAGFGRLVFTRDALPVIQPLRFCLRGGQLLLPTRSGSSLVRAVRGAVVAFQADCLDEVTGVGWTITAIGPAHVLTDPDDIAAAASLGLHSWIPLPAYTYLAVEIGLIRGYRLS
jgi:hypothetical protein